MHAGPSSSPFRFCRYHTRWFTANRKKKVTVSATSAASQVDPSSRLDSRMDAQVLSEPGVTYSPSPALFTRAALLAFRRPNKLRLPPVSASVESVSVSLECSEKTWKLAWCISTRYVSIGQHIATARAYKGYGIVPIPCPTRALACFPAAP